MCRPSHKRGRSTSMDSVEVGKFGKNTLRALGEEHEKDFNQTKQLLYGIVSKTPPLSYKEPSPAVVFNAFIVVDRRGQRTPTIIIGCTSYSYAKLLRRRIQNSGVLTRSNTRFQVAIGNNGQDYHTKSYPIGSRDAGTGGGDFESQGMTSPRDIRPGILIDGLSLAAICRLFKAQGGGNRQSFLPV